LVLVATVGSDSDPTDGFPDLHFFPNTLPADKHP